MCLNLPSYLLLFVPSALHSLFFSLSSSFRLIENFLLLHLLPSLFFFFFLTNYMLLNNFSGCPGAAAAHRSLLVFVHPVTKNNISWHKLIEIQISLFISKVLLKYCSTYLLEAEVLCFSDLWFLYMRYYMSGKYLLFFFFQAWIS